MQGARILVVDDQEGNRQIVRDVLEPLGYHIAEASDGEDALEAVAREVPDLILCDVVMPRCDGYAVCRALKSDPKTRVSSRSSCSRRSTSCPTRSRRSSWARTTI